MNDWDRDNLNFILNISPETLRDFLSIMSPEDVAYAFELIRTAKAEIIVEQMEYDEINSDIDIEMSDAGAVLSKFTLKG